jgi:hypothetical protein
MTEQAQSIEAALADRYIGERELGRGGMAVVYLAHDRKHDRPVAVKVLLPDVAKALGSERFLQEVRLTAQLNHPHILPLLDSGEADGFLYYAMPYVEGETLRQRIDREGCLPIKDALRITREVAGALHYAHGRNVVHRDIKPENVLLSAGQAVVADFGIAKALSEAGSERLTETGIGIGIGTPAYMSPEQAGGEVQVDGRSDLYSLACVLYEMLTGEPPFSGPTAQVIIAKQLRQPPPSVRVTRYTVTPGLDAVLRRALAKVPADRYATVEQFTGALDHAVERRRQFTRRLMPAAAVAGVAAVAVAVFGLPGSNGGENGNTSPLAAVQLSVLPVVARDGSADTSPSVQRMQRLFAAELARYRGLEVVDPLSLNDADLETAGVQYVVRLTTTPASDALEIAYVNRLLLQYRRRAAADPNPAGERTAGGGPGGGDGRVGQGARRGAVPGPGDQRRRRAGVPAGDRVQLSLHSRWPRALRARGGVGSGLHRPPCLPRLGPRGHRRHRDGGGARRGAPGAQG